MPQEERTPDITENKSSMEILSELFSSFDVEPPIIIKTEKPDSSKKHKKSKKKHKHKEKKSKKKEKKRKRSSSVSSNSERDTSTTEVKKEKESPSKKIKIESTSTKDAKIKSENLESSKIVSVKSETENHTETNSEKRTKKIKNIEFSSIFEATIREIQEKHQKVSPEEGEIQLSEEDKPKAKKKHKHSLEKHKKRKRAHSKEHSKSKITKGEKDGSPARCSKRDDKSDDDTRKNKSKDAFYRDSHKYKNDYYKDKDNKKVIQRDNDYHREVYKTRSEEDEDYKYRKQRDNFYKESDRHKSKERSPRERNEHDDKWFMRNRYRGYTGRDDVSARRYRDTAKDRNHIDKKKLLEIARKNAILMMKSGSLPGALTLGRQAQEKVLAAIRAGGKTINELTEFCKTLSTKEEVEEISAGSGNEDHESDNDQKVFHHPFQIKDRPSAIVMNIKNSVPLPTKTAQARNTELRLQFPVSSGTLHRKTEKEWIPVVPKKIETPPVVKSPSPVGSVPLPIEPPPFIEPTVLEPEPEPPVFTSSPDIDIDVGQIVAQRLLALRKLQENPYDVEALTTMHKSQNEIKTWAESKQEPGQFTGTTGANILSQAELSAGYQAWAKKDQLQNAAPVSGGMGMHLLKKMGWNPGEGLGKDKSGALQPLLLEVKLDKKGLVANEEQKQKVPVKVKVPKLTSKTLEAKHPVSLLGEFSAKRKLGPPQFTLLLDSGPDHKKAFIYQVEINGLICKPDNPSPNKKQAKADAARLCLQKLGLLSVVSLQV